MVKELLDMDAITQEAFDIKKTITKIIVIIFIIKTSLIALYIQHFLISLNNES